MALLMVASAGITFAPSAVAATLPFPLLLPIPVDATVLAGGPHPSNGGAYGTRSSVDFGVSGGPVGLQVMAAHDGVAKVIDSYNGKPCLISVTHPSGWQTRYQHLLNVPAGIDGGTVKAGQLIGSMGQAFDPDSPRSVVNTCGTATARFPHVHFSLYRNTAAATAQANWTEQPIDGTSIGGYTVHQYATRYCGYWTRDRDPSGAPLADARTACAAVPSLINNQYTAGNGASDASPWKAAYTTAMGYAVSLVAKVGSGCEQRFTGGTLGDAALMQPGCSGTVYRVTGAHWKRVAQIGAATIGYPKNSSHRYGASWAQDFTGGTWGAVLLVIPDVANTQAFVVRSGMRSLYLSAGGAGGSWGVPTSDEVAVYGGVAAYQVFTGGKKWWSQHQVGQGASSSSVWTGAYSGALGVPVSTVHAWGPGCVQNLTGGTLGDAALMQPGCSGTVYTVTGAHWKRVAQIGAATIGYPTNNSQRYGASWKQDFTRGTWGIVLLMIPDVANTQAFVVRSGMRSLYLGAGGAGGSWGVPTSDEVAVYGGVAAYQVFTGGKKWWWAYQVGQAASFLTKSSWTGAYSGALGVPVNTVHSWGPGCIQNFTGGTLGDAALMQPGCSGTVYTVTGAHWKRVAQIGAPTIGYPTNNSHRYGASWTQDFARGTWGAVLLMIPDVANTQAFVLRTGMRNRYFSDGGAAGKWGVATSDEYSVPVGARQNFTGGAMTWRAYSDSLSEGQTLGTNGKLFSMDERFQLIVQGDGNLVLYGPSGALWSSRTVGISSPRLVMQGDSNLVLYDSSNVARWSSGTTTFKGARLAVQNDGNLAVRDRNGAAIWSRFSGRIQVDPQGTISIRSTLTGRFWTSELNYSGAWNGAIRAERTGVGAWETFQLIGDCRSSSGCAIKSLASSRYLTAELNYTGNGDRMVRASATSINGWERYQLVGDCGSSGGCGVKSVANGKYLSADYSFLPSDYRYGLVRARASQVSGWESFRIYQS